MLGLLVGGRYDHTESAQAPSVGLWRRLLNLLLRRN
jgi:hypothetical protein